VDPPGQENRSNALRVSLMDLCLFMVSFEDFECAHIVRSEQRIANFVASKDGFTSRTSTRRAYTNISILTDADVTKSSN